MYNYKLQITILKSYVTTIITIAECYITNTSKKFPCAAGHDANQIQQRIPCLCSEVPKRPKTMLGASYFGQ